MKKEFRHIGRKVLIGYVVLIVIAVCALAYIYGMVMDISAEEDINNVPRQKIYLVTETQSLLFESETMGQLLDMEEEDYTHFNETLDKAHENMDALRSIVDDESLLARIDTIDMLIERKRGNTNDLLEIWKQANSDLYAKNIEKALAIKRPVVEEKGIQERVISQKDTVIVTPKKRGFFKRLAEVFVPTTQDSSIIVSANEQLLKDTLVNAYNPNDELTKTLRNIQSNVASERVKLRELLVDRSAALRYDNSLITSRINQILRDMEDDELNASLNRMLHRQELLGKTSYLITAIALLSIFVTVFFLFLIGRDLFKSRYYRKKMEEALDSRERLILTISHDIRAPLSSIIGFTELLQRSYPTEQQRIYLRNMYGSSHHILSLVNDLLDFERLESGKMEIHNVPFRVPVFFEEVFESFQPQALAKGLDFSLDCMEATDDVYTGDSVRIRQITGNLINNALKFTTKGRVELIIDSSQLALPSGESDKTPSSQLIITVRDSGPGIAEKEQEKIFAEFTRLEGAEKTEGFGLGLSITWRLVSLLGGKLDIKSKVGEGSDFIVTLPLPLAENQLLPEQELISEDYVTDAKLFEGNRVTCLIVDDDLLQIALMEEILKQNHIQAISCTNPHAVIDLLRENSIDIMLSDIQMPDMDGFTLINMIRNSDLPDAKTLPVIVLSGSIGKDNKKYLEAGFTDSLAKPFTGQQLISVLHKNLPQVQKVSERKTDLSALTEFAAGDQNASNAILQTFFEETKKSIDTFCKALEAKDRSTAGALAHKLVPLFTLLGADILVQQLRLLQLNDEELTDSGWTRLLTDVIEQASSLIEQAN